MWYILTWLLYLILTLFVGGITVAIIYARWNYGVLENTRGLPFVLKPYFIGGSDPFFYKTICCNEDTKRVKKYGHIFGMYEARSPHIYISDPELIRLVFIKDFDHFHNKRIFDVGHELINEMMDLLPYDKWKVVRNFLSPQLTTGKLRAMSYQMLDAINEWSSKLHNKADGRIYKFNPKDEFTTLTMDVIARCAFGTKLEVGDDPNNSFKKYVRQLVFEDSDPPGLIFTVVMMFPILGKLGSFFPKEVMDFFGDLLRNMLHARKQSGQGRINDFADVMNDMIEKCSTEEYRRLGITENTVMCQAMFFLFAGFETTASTLTLMAYRLAKNPEIQDKLLKEVDEYMERHDGKIDHENIGELVYLNACMTETLRMDPQLIRVERVCVKDWHHEPTGLTVKKGITIQVPVYAVHYDEKNFPEPNEFRPERFLPENKDKLNPYAFLSFGQGPHNCIGMRFAREEIQLTMASILKDCRFEDTEGAKLKMKPGRLFNPNFEPYSLSIVPRH